MHIHHPSGGLLFAIGAERPIAIKTRASSPHKWPRMVRMLLQPLTLFIAVNNHTSLHISMSMYSSPARHTVLGEGDLCLLPPAADTPLFPSGTSSRVVREPSLHTNGTLAPSPPDALFSSLLFTPETDSLGSSLSLSDDVSWPKDEDWWSGAQLSLTTSSTSESSLLSPVLRHSSLEASLASSSSEFVSHFSLIA